MDRKTNGNEKEEDGEGQKSGEKNVTKIKFDDLKKEIREEDFFGPQLEMTSQANNKQKDSDGMKKPYAHPNGPRGTKVNQREE